MKTLDFINNCIFFLLPAIIIIFPYPEPIIFILITGILLKYSVKNYLADFFTIHKMTLFLMLYLLIVFISQIVSKNPFSGILIFIRYVEGFFIIFLLLKGFKLYKTSPEIILRGLMFAAIIASIYSIADYITTYGSTLTIKEDRLTKLGSEHFGGEFGIIGATGIVLFFINTLERKNIIYKFIHILFGLFCFIGVYFTLTRTWLLSAFIALCTYLVINNLKIFFVLIILPLLLFIVLYNYDFISFQNKNSNLLASRTIQMVELSIGSGDIEKTSVMGRFLKWGLALKTINQNPLLGVGINNVNLGIPMIEDIGNKRIDNHYMDLIANSGLLAFLAFVVWESLIFYKLFQQSKKSKLSQTLLAIMMLWIFGAVFWATTYGRIFIYFSYVIALIIYSINPSNKQKT